VNLPPAWRVRWWLWAVPLALVLGNTVLLVVHPGRTGAGFAEMEKELERETRALQAVNDKERGVESMLTDARSSREALVELYRRGFSTEAERLTQLISEVKRLAQRSGMMPQSISYPEEELEEYGLVRMSLVFGVKGTYPQVRMLVNLLERSDLFLVLERVRLGGAQESSLSISLEISTFFANTPIPTGAESLAAEAIESEPAKSPAGDTEARSAAPVVARRAES